jgi:hypothetical protein
MQKSKKFLKSDPVRIDGVIPLERERWNKRVVQRQHQREAQVLLETLGKHTACFYPGCGLDWGPLGHLTPLCDTFVFCDWSRLADDIIVGDQFGGLQCEFLVNLDSETINYLSRNEFPCPPWRIEGGYGIPPWGKYGRLLSGTGKAKTPIHLLYFGVEGITLFFNLFTVSNTSPKAMCLKGSGGLAGDPAHIHDWDAPLGTLVQRCEHRPTHLIVDDQPPPGWPHTVFWRRFVNWEGRPKGYVRKD